jgi:hypothetical protein
MKIVCNYAFKDFIKLFPDNSINYEFSENSDIIDCDYYIVFNQLNVNKINTTETKIYITIEPPNIRTYTFNEINQYDLIISNFELYNNQLIPFYYPCLLDTTYTEIINYKFNKCKTLSCINKFKLLPILCLFRSFLFQ